MPRKHEKEYRKFVMKISKWLKETKNRIEMLPDMERLGSLTYDQWCKIFKEQRQFKEIPAPPPPPPPRLLKEGGKPEPPPKK
jgi:hypothetical protein